MAVQGDVADHPSHEALIQTSLNKFGTLDILVSNAGIEIHEPAIRPTFRDIA